MFSSDTESRVFNCPGAEANEKQKTLDSRLKTCGNDDRGTPSDSKSGEIQNQILVLPHRPFDGKEFGAG